MIAVGVTQQMIQSIASSSGTLAASDNVTDTTVTVAQQGTTSIFSIPENVATTTEQEQIRT